MMYVLDPADESSRERHTSKELDAAIYGTRDNCAAPPVTNYDEAKCAGGFAMPAFTRLPIRIPNGHMKAPVSARYSVAAVEWWYTFEIAPGYFEQWSEAELVKINRKG